MKGHWFSDAMLAKVPSIYSDKGASMFMNGKGYDYIYPWKSKKQHAEALMSFIHDVGIPQTIVSDGRKELWQAIAQKHATDTTFSRHSQSHTAHGKMPLKQAFMRPKRVHDETLDRLACFNNFGHMLPSGLPTSDT